MAKKDELEELKKKVEELEKEKEKKEEDKEDLISSVKGIEFILLLIVALGFIYFVDRGSFNAIIRGIQTLLTWDF